MTKQTRQEQGSRLRLYFRKAPERDRYFAGDRHIRSALRRIVRGKKIGGVEKVFLNLCKGLDRLRVDYTVNADFTLIGSQDKVVVLGTGSYSLQGYNRPNPIVAGIGLMTHPSEWPELCKEFPVVKYLQHSEWATNVYSPYFGKHICDSWPAGIETEKWKPTGATATHDILIYNKVRWEHEKYNEVLVEPIKRILAAKGLKYREIVYGSYNESQYFELLQTSRAMIFLCEHESQGFACCEAMSMNIPVFAWENGYCLDPNRFKWNDPVIPATSVPFFDSRCGDKFKDIQEFMDRFPAFYSRVREGCFEPRAYVLENLTLEKSAVRMLEILDQIQ